MIRIYSLQALFYSKRILFLEHHIVPYTAHRKQEEKKSSYHELYQMPFYKLVWNS